MKATHFGSLGRLRLVTLAAVVVMVGMSMAGSSAVAAPSDQAAATATPFRFLTPTPIVSRPATTTSATTPPRAGGLPIELALPLLVGGASALSGGVYMLRRGRRRN